MPILQVDTHVSELIFDSMKQMTMAHNFRYNDDISETEKGKLNKEFKLIIATVENDNDKTNFLNLRVQALYEITLYHNAEGDTEAGRKRVMRDVEDLIFEYERFAPTGVLSDVRQKFVDSTLLINWTTEAINVGEDSRLRTIIQYQIGYKVPKS